MIISGTAIPSTELSSSWGLNATYEGKIIASDVTITISGGSWASFDTDRGEGTVTWDSCTSTINGSGNPVIYSTGDITITDSTGTANRAQAIVIDGKNSATIMSSNLKCSVSKNSDKDDDCGILIYQSMSGDDASGISAFNCQDSTVEIISSTSYYSQAPMIYVLTGSWNKFKQLPIHFRLKYIFKYSRRWLAKK